MGEFSHILFDNESVQSFWLVGVCHLQRFSHRDKTITINPTAFLSGVDVVSPYLVKVLFGYSFVHFTRCLPQVVCQLDERL